MNSCFFPQDWVCIYVVKNDVINFFPLLSLHFELFSLLYIIFFHIFSFLSLCLSFTLLLSASSPSSAHTENSGVRAHVPQNGGQSHRPTLAPLLSCA